MFICNTKTFSSQLSASVGAFLLCFGLGVGSAAADGELDGYRPDEEEQNSEPEVVVEKVDPDAAKHGIGLRLRYVFVPKGLIELFMEDAAGGMGNPGFGLDYVYRKKNFEFSAGFEYDSLNGTKGAYIERGGAFNESGTVDIVEFDDLAWLTLDASFVWHKPLTELVALRYGGGFGFGLVSGEVISSDAACTSDNIQVDCFPSGPQQNEKQDFFRFPPVFNALFGVQLTPGENLAINIEVGMRTVFYSGLGVQYFF